MKRLTLLGLIVAVCSSAGCLFGDPATSPTNYTLVNPVVEVFQGSLDKDGAATYAFVVGNPDPLRVTLASVTNATTGAAVTTAIKLQVGTTDGTTCTPFFTTTTSAALVAQYLQVATAGAYCIGISDPGTMTSSLNFAVRISHS